MAFHPLLDWRVARDMLDLLDGRPLDLQREAALEQRRAEEFAGSFDGKVTRLAGDVHGVDLDDRFLLVANPLEDASEEGAAGRMALAIADVEDRGFSRSGPRPYRVASSFDLLRRPGWVLFQLTDQ
jgi:hypothetical protein